MDGGQLEHRDSIIQAIRGLAPVVAEHRAEFDRDRRLPAAVFDALVAADLFRLWTPRQLGGAEISARAFVNIIEEAAALDASVGWILTNGALMSWTGSFLPPHVAQSWFGSPDCFIACSIAALGTARRENGGYRVSGRWPFSSGVQLSRRVMGLCAVEGEPDEAGKKLICAYFPSEDIQIIDNWHVSGLRGTGSCEFRAEGVFVPADHVQNFPGMRLSQIGPLYRMPVGSLFPFSIGVVPLGIARAAIEAFVAIAGRTREETGAPLREREMIQTEVARAEALRRSAKALILDALDDLETALDQEGEELVRVRAFFRVALAHAAETCQRVVHMMAAAAGTAAIRENSPLERCIRDMDAAAKHVALGPHNFVVGGQVLLGLEPDTSKF